MSWTPKRLTLAELGTAKAQLRMIEKEQRLTFCGSCMQTIDVIMSYRCYYCHQWFCEECMGKHLED